MISLEEVRQTVMTAYAAAHAVSYAATLVNYPNRTVVDLENQRLPFVSVELELPNTPQAALGEQEILVHGTLRVYFYYRKGTGTAPSYLFADHLNAQLGAQLVGPIYYQPVQTTVVNSFPGWEGLMCSLSFDVVSGVTCTV